MPSLLLAAMKPKADKAGGDKAKVEDEEESESSEMEFARLASEASAAGDHEAAAEALVSAIKACMTSYGAKE